MIKWCLLVLVSLVGCRKINTDTSAIFNDVRKCCDEVIYWDRSIDGMIMPTDFDVLDGDRAVQIALLNNRSLQATYESLGIAQADLVQAGLLKNPIFAFSYRFSTDPTITNLIDGSLIQNMLEAVLIPLKKRMAKAELEATKASVMDLVSNTIAETRKAFFMLQGEQLIWDLQKQLLLASELSYEAAQKLHAAKNLRSLDVSLKRAFFEQARLAVATQEVVVLEAREKLNVLMGLWGRGIDWRFDAKLPPLPAAEDTFDDAENSAIEASWVLQAAYKELESLAAGYGIDTTRLVLPEFTAGVSTERDDSVWYVGPAMSLAIPFFDWGQANSAKAKAAILQKWNAYTAMAVEVRSLARRARFSLLNSYRQSRFLDQVMVPLAEQVMEETLRQHNAMQIGVFRVLEAKKMEIEKQIEAVEKKRDYWVDRITLEALLLGGTE